MPPIGQYSRLVGSLEAGLLRGSRGQGQDSHPQDRAEHCIRLATACGRLDTACSKVPLFSIVHPPPLECNITKGLRMKSKHNLQPSAVCVKVVPQVSA